MCRRARTSAIAVCCAALLGAAACDHFLVVYASGARRAVRAVRPGGTTLGSFDVTA